MTRWRWGAALLGIGLLVAVLAAADLGDVARHLARLTPIELALLIVIYFAGRLGGVVSWLLTMTVDLNARWLARLLRVHMIGGAVERVTPLAGMGGEPIKVAILKREYGIGLRESTASLVLTRMTDLGAIVLFCLLGLLTAAVQGPGGAALWRPAVLSLAFLSLAAALVFAMQRLRVLARVMPWLRRRWPARWAAGGRAHALAEAVVDVERRLGEAYVQRPGRLLLSVLATFVEWLFEAALIHAGLSFLDAPVAPSTAVSIAAFALAVRTAFFFVPADIGTQEAALVAAGGALAGDAGLGLALAAVVRLAELVWTTLGVVVGVRYVFGSRPPEPAGGGGEPFHR